ncbi:hypothetical protein C8N40_11197 [Pontibacter mucosus]|uniref:Uncharacterized protein n=1 Tax=Pontibacter mucosus TaxID=1649266 RepID=A0A2T5YD35_9BACT|nr:hypothetical protein [Pontibacter mucosus]PTX14432.1 hypothetical protein C8N40_11197 [Pontibacter mucosus]
MSKAKEIAQWVIDNRYPKSEKEKLSDTELFNELVDKIEAAQLATLEKAAENAKQLTIEGEMTERQVIDKASITSKDNLI